MTPFNFAALGKELFLRSSCVVPCSRCRALTISPCGLCAVCCKSHHA